MLARSCSPSRQNVSTHSRSNDRDSVLLPFFRLIVLWPSGSVDDAALEFLHALNIGPLEVVQNACPMKKHVTSVLEQPRGSVGIGLLQLDEPLASLLLPVTSDHFGFEVHVLAESEYLANFVEVLPDVGRIGKESRPFGLWFSLSVL